MCKFDPAQTPAAGLLRLARDKAGMTQADPASNAGISQQAVSVCETGRKEPMLPTLQRLLTAAGLETRICLEPIDDHNATPDGFMKTRPPARRAELATRADRGLKLRDFAVCTHPNHGEAGYVWEPHVPGAGHSRTSEGIGAEIGVWNKLLKLFEPGEGFVSYGVVEDRLLERYPDEFTLLLHRYGHK